MYRQIFFVALLCTLFLSSLSVAQLQTYTIPLYYQSGSCLDTIYFGVSTDPCVSRNLDLCIEEELTPRPPIGVCDLRFHNEYLGQGSKKDFRHSFSECQFDTFKVRYQLPTGETMLSFSWPTDIGLNGCGGWILSGSGLDSNIRIDMTHQSSVTFRDEDGVLTIRSALPTYPTDSIRYRTFSMESLALDCAYDSRGKLTYGKSYKPKEDKVEFIAYFTNTETTSVNGLQIEFQVPVDTTTMKFSSFTHYTVDKKKKKFQFSGATIPSTFPYQSISIEGFGKEPKDQRVRKWFWTKDGNREGSIRNGNYSITNTLRLPMPNTINAGEELFAQIYRTVPLIIGDTTRTDAKKYVYHKKYHDVLKSFVKRPGHQTKQLLHNRMASCLNMFDRQTASGDRLGKSIIKAQHSLPPDKHQNRLFGEALAFAINLQFSETEKVPAGLGALRINKPEEPFDGLTLDSLLAKANQYLTWCPSSSPYSADDLADIMAAINGGFGGPLDTLSWSGTKVRFNAVKVLGDLGGWLLRDTGVTPKIQSDFDLSSRAEPLQFSLKQNYPNPFNPSTVISYSLSVPSSVTLKVFNLLGQEIVTLLDNEEYNAGEHEVEFDASNLASGVYYYKLEVKDLGSNAVTFTSLMKMAVIK